MDAKMTKTLVKQKQILTLGEFYKEILNPTIETLAVYETHFLEEHTHNELEILKKAAKERKRCRLLLEHFTENELKGKKNYDTLFKLSTSGHYAREDRGKKCIWPLAEFCIKNKIPLLGTSYGETKDMNKKMVNKINKLIAKSPKDNLDIVILGPMHRLSEDPLFNSNDERFSEAELAEEYDSGIIKLADRRYELKTKL